MRHANRHRRRARRNPSEHESGGGGDTTMLLLLVGGFLLLTQTGQTMLAQLGVGTAATTATGLPAGTIRLANGQYQLPSGQVVGTPYTGYQPVAGSSTSSVVTTVAGVAAAVSPLVSFFKNLFSSTAGGTGSGGATGSPGAGGSASIPAPTTGNGPGSVNTSVGQLTLSDGSVLDISGFDPGFLGADLSLVAPGAGLDLSLLTAPDPGVTFPDFQTGLDTSGFSFADFGLVDPNAIQFAGYQRSRFGALSPSRLPGFVPIPVRHY